MAMPRKQKMPYSIHEKGTCSPSSSSPPRRAESSCVAPVWSSTSSQDWYSGLDAILVSRPVEPE
ncbi:hypothetical protein MKX07_005512 [Trichoderma sp. CBMAI-0711]|nr:hypothetical protein MKX07_005512 [Trichoderma sp. CBMAI-0711]